MRGAKQKQSRGKAKHNQKQRQRQRENQSQSKGKANQRNGGELSRNLLSANVHVRPKKKAVQNCSPVKPPCTTTSGNRLYSAPGGRGGQEGTRKRKEGTKDGGEERAELSQSNDAMEYDLTEMALFGSEAKEDFLARPSGWPVSYNPRGQALER